MDDGMVDHEASPFLYGTLSGVRSTAQNTVIRHVSYSTSHDVQYSASYACYHTSNLGHRNE